MSSYSDYTDESDEEYPDLEISGWGAQQTNDGSTEVTVSAAGWGALIDPSVKLKSNGIGSGQLHRKGKNFNPIDEQIILDRRLGKPVPKGGLNGSKKKKKRKGKSGAPPPPPPQPTKSIAPARNLPPAPSRGRPPIQPGASAWATTALVETPFWEQSSNDSAASKYADPAPQRQQPSWGQQQQVPRQKPQQQQQNLPQATWNQQPQSTKQTPTWGQVHQQLPSQQQSSWNQQPPSQQQPQKAPQQPPQKIQPQMSWGQNSQPTLDQPQQTSWNNGPLLGTSASKYASPSVKNTTYAQPTPPQPQAPAPPQSQQSFAVNSNTPCLTFKIELAPGVTASLPVYANDNPVSVVNEFERKHQLVMSDAAKSKFAERVAMLLSQYKTN